MLFYSAIVGRALTHVYMHICTCIIYKHIHVYMYIHVHHVLTNLYWWWIASRNSSSLKRRRSDLAPCLLLASGSRLCSSRRLRGLDWLSRYQGVPIIRNLWLSTRPWWSRPTSVRLDCLHPLRIGKLILTLSVVSSVLCSCCWWWQLLNPCIWMDTGGQSVAIMEFCTVITA